MSDRSVNSDNYPEPIKDYISRCYGKPVNFALMEGFTDRAVRQMIARGDVVIGGQRFICTRKELKGGK
ncbi:MAG: hypothetical protein ACRC8W_04790 [Plesiomonas shigelloides]